MKSNVLISGSAWTLARLLDFETRRNLKTRLASWLLVQTIQVILFGSWFSWLVVDLTGVLILGILLFAGSYSKWGVFFGAIILIWTRALIGVLVPALSCITLKELCLSSLRQPLPFLSMLDLLQHVCGNFIDLTCYPNRFTIFTVMWMLTNISLIWLITFSLFRLMATALSLRLKIGFL